MTIRGMKRRRPGTVKHGDRTSQSLIRDLEVIEVEVERIKPNPRNPKTHAAKQIGQIVASICEFGFCNPILADEQDRIIAGHGRLEAARLLGMATVPLIRLAGLTAAQKTALALADNRIAENAGWDSELLALEIESLVDTDVELTVTGFEMGEIDLLLQEGDDGPVLDGDDDIPEGGPDSVIVTRPGDLWLIGGRHRLLCGDAREPGAYEQLLDGKQAALCFTDPPYNVAIGGHVSGLGRHRHHEFAMASGEMSEAGFVAFLKTTLGNCARVSADGAIHFVCMDWRHIHALLSVGRDVYSELKNLCVWNKTNGGMGALYRSKYELVAVFKVGTAAHINNVALGALGRYRTNVWDHAGANSFGAGRDAALAMHPTVKPVGLVADAILDCSNRGDLVLDPFAGAGTTLVAAERTGRRGAAMELDATYVDVALRRCRNAFGAEVTHAESGRSFDALAEERLAEQAEEEGK
ncbi:MULTISPECIES: DNA methyltransferase [unclassified Minwuia]|uniref:site-specific DNA-methyltransferase n=1 Tax=unclassified Minwuia TaxID=2618799 RepID=UPI0024786B62|nr:MULTISPECIES: DNA methyltransferase [unclassified Minwuia]